MYSIAGWEQSTETTSSKHEGRFYGAATWSITFPIVGALTDILMTTTVHYCAVHIYFPFRLVVQFFHGSHVPFAWIMVPITSADLCTISSTDHLPQPLSILISRYCEVSLRQVKLVFVLNLHLLKPQYLTPAQVRLLYKSLHSSNTSWEHQGLFNWITWAAHIFLLIAIV